MFAAGRLPGGFTVLLPSGVCPAVLMPDISTAVVSTAVLAKGESLRNQKSSLRLCLRSSCLRLPFSFSLRSSSVTRSMPGTGEGLPSFMATKTR